MAMLTTSKKSRRQFLMTGTVVGTGVIVGGVARCTNAGEAGKGGTQAPEDVAPPEDLMREHGVLRRILLIYQEERRQIRNNQGADTAALMSAAKLVRTFVEDYHEKLEEDYLFPRFEKVGKLIDLVKTLREQHDAGRKLTDEVMKLATSGDSKRLSRLLGQFTGMYRPHAAREDTVLFPAIRSVMTPKEFDEMGDRFEDKEHKLFGKNGFEGIVAKVAEMEKTLRIHSLSQFTPKV
jgi:hemerythrin-like domain-containing protein